MAAVLGACLEGRGPCNFRRLHCEFDEAELEIIRREKSKPTGPPR